MALIWHFAFRKAAKAAGQPVPQLKRLPVPPRAGHLVKIDEIESLAPLRYEIVA